MKHFMKQISKTLYEKRGKKFIPVGKDDIIVPHGDGDYLVRVHNHSTKTTSRRIPLSVDWAKVEIALDEAADAITTALMEHNKAELNPRPNTPLEKKAWNAYCKVLPVNRLTFSHKSAYEIAQNSVRCLRENLRGKRKCPDGCLETYAER